MRILLTGVTGLRNRGVEALVDTIIHQLEARIPQASFTVATADTDYDDWILGSRKNVQVISDAAKPVEGLATSNWRWKVQLAAAGAYKKVAPDYVRLMGAITGTDVVLVTGGDIFSSEYGTNSLLRHLEVMRIALDERKRVHIVAQSIGPFKKEEETRAFVGIAERCHLITVRENITYNYLTQDLGLPKNKVVRVADPAFLLTTPTSEERDKLARSLQPQGDGPIVAVAPSGGISKFLASNREQHEDAWVQQLQKLLDLGLRVIVIPHVQNIRMYNNDTALATGLVRRLGFDPRISVAAEDWSAGEYKAIISKCDMVIAERMHAAIAGLSSGVCTIAVQYSIKSAGIMNDMLGDDNEGCLLPFEQFVDPEVGGRVIENVWNNRESISKRLQAALPRVKEASHKTFDLIARDLGQA